MLPLLTVAGRYSDGSGFLAAVEGSPVVNSRSPSITANPLFGGAGVATDCVADDRLETATDLLAEELRGFAPLAQRNAKKLLNDIADAGLSSAIELEGHAYGRLRTADDFREGVEAFHQKRKPNFRGS